MDANGNPVTDASGNYVLGATGSAGTDPPIPTSALSLISGGWNVAAAQNILLQEVNNPNGVFDINGGALTTITLIMRPMPTSICPPATWCNWGRPPSSLPRSAGRSTIMSRHLSVHPEYHGGCRRRDSGDPDSPDSLILFPSPQGSLTIDTTGSLVSSLEPRSRRPPAFQSDCLGRRRQQRQYTSTHNFGANDHAASPVHLERSDADLILNIWRQHEL